MHLEWMLCGLTGGGSTKVSADNSCPTLHCDRLTRTAGKQTAHVGFNPSLTDISPSLNGPLGPCLQFFIRLLTGDDALEPGAGRPIGSLSAMTPDN